MSKSQHIEDNNPIRVPNPDKQMTREPIGKAAVEKPPERDRQDQEAIEDFGEEGAGAGPRE